jgi:hypothetical protein
MIRWRTILLGLLALFILIQFIRPAPNKSTAVFSNDLEKTVNVPENVQSILKNACYDCHSNNTRYPWYAGVQPVGWLLANHIRNGKEKLNFNEFGSYPVRRQVSKLNGIANSIKHGSMPLSTYTMMHKEARLSAGEKALVIDWALRTKDSLRAKN